MYVDSTIRNVVPYINACHTRSNEHFVSMKILQKYLGQLTLPA
jgi:hypothetical protein